MEKIDGTWIAKRLARSRGSQARLAEALGLTADKMSKVLSDVRKLTPDETVAMLIFFGVITPEMLDPEAAMNRLNRLPANKRQQVERFVDFLLSDPENVTVEQDLERSGP